MPGKKIGVRAKQALARGTLNIGLRREFRMKKQAAIQTQWVKELRRRLAAHRANKPVPKSQGMADRIKQAEDFEKWDREKEYLERAIDAAVKKANALLASADATRKATKSLARRLAGSKKK